MASIINCSYYKNYEINTHETIRVGINKSVLKSGIFIRCNRDLLQLLPSSKKESIPVTAAMKKTFSSTNAATINDPYQQLRPPSYDHPNQQQPPSPTTRAAGDAASANNWLQLSGQQAGNHLRRRGGA